jgi:phosphoglycolate phosphatase-like HAD superfamily hydrolase
MKIGPEGQRTTIFFDLDGPLLDVRARYHGVYASIARELGIEPLPLARYWAEKRKRTPLDQFFAGYPDHERLRAVYLERWLAQIEAPDWLAHDTVVPGAPECLKVLREHHRLVLVSLRRDPAALRRQLEWTGLMGFFSMVRSGWEASLPATTDDREAGETLPRSGGAGLKSDWMQELLADGDGVLIGDSEIDMEAAQLARIFAIGVSFGIREPDDLRRWGAEAMVDSLGEIPDILTCRRQLGMTPPAHAPASSGGGCEAA